MNPFQIGVIGICVALNMLDGFDVLVMAFTASGVAKEWSLSASQVGVLLSAGLFGMAAGSLFVAPWADKLGRRIVILLCLATITLGLLLSAAARNQPELAALRVLTGLGIGGILATVNVIAAEYSPDKWRSTAISLYAAGYPIGAIVGGVISAVLIEAHGWRSAFLLGAFATALMVPVVLRYLPESLDFLLSKQPPDALRKANRVLRQLQRPELGELPAASLQATTASAAPRSPLSGAVLRPTLLTWAAFFCVMAALYFVNSWTPRLLTASGLSASQGITGGVLINVGGLIGTLLFGVVVARVDVRRLTLAFVAVAALAAGLFGVVFSQLGLALTVATLLGGSINGVIAGLYARTPGLYEANQRGTGMGWALGVGRLGAIASPLVAGSLLDHAWQPAQLYFLTVLPLVLALAAIAAIRNTDMRWTAPAA